MNFCLWERLPAAIEVTGHLLIVAGSHSHQKNADLSVSFHAFTIFSQIFKTIAIKQGDLLSFDSN
jgi:hypothetical protein